MGRIQLQINTVVLCTSDSDRTFLKILVMDHNEFSYLSVPMYNPYLDENNKKNIMK